MVKAFISSSEYAGGLDHDDKGTPGTNDQFGLKLIDPPSHIVTGFTFNSLALDSSNKQVPKK